MPRVHALDEGHGIREGMEGIQAAAEVSRVLV